MNCFVKTALVAALLTLSSGISFAAGEKAPGSDSKGAATSLGEAVKSDAKASAISAKSYAKDKTADAKSVAKAKLVDINTATAAEIKAIPGIGDVLAAKIIAGRPYANKTQLKSRKILPPTVYEQVKDLIIAKMIK